MNPAFLQDILPGPQIHLDEPLCLHTSFKVGGPAAALVEIRTEDQLRSLLLALAERDIPWRVLGRGTNLLVSDSGYDGVLLKLDMKDLHVRDGLVHAGAALSLKQLFERALELGYTGLEFAAGIPGTVGGAVYMNAGAYGGEIRDVLCSVRAMLPDGSVKEFGSGDLHLGYRSSSVGTRRLVLLSAAFRLPQGDVQQSRRTAETLMQRRRDRQPLEYASAGSTFKRPPGRFAGTLIESCGLKGASCGGAMVSAKHAGFVINTGGASAGDIHRLISEVQDAVRLLTGVSLEPEVQQIGWFHA